MPYLKNTRYINLVCSLTNARYTNLHSFLLRVERVTLTHDVWVLYGTPRRRHKKYLIPEIQTGDWTLRCRGLFVTTARWMTSTRHHFRRSLLPCRTDCNSSITTLCRHVTFTLPNPSTVTQAFRITWHRHDNSEGGGGRGRGSVATLSVSQLHSGIW
jgi:hypothetical protein